MRFPSYSSEWHSYTLGEILTFYSTNSFSREKLNYDTGSVKNIHYGDIHTKFPSIVSVSDNKDIPFINNEIDLSKYSEDQYLQNGDLIIADASEDYEDIGKAIEVKNIDDEKVLAGLHTILARDNNNITVNGFKAYLFSTNSLKTKIKIIANGISVLGISKNSLSKLTVNVPSKNEQNVVVDFISLIDNKIELLEQKHQYYLDFKKFLMQQIFAQKLRFNFNDAWKTVKIKDIFDERSEKGFLDLELLSVTLNDGVIKRSEIESKDNSNENKSNYKHVLPGDIVYNSMRMWQGASGVSPYEGIVSPAYTILIPKNVYSKYFGYYFKTNEMVYQFKKYSQGLTSDTWNLKYPLISEIKIKIPSIEEQKEITNVFEIMDEKIKILQNNIDELTTFKKGLLQQMFVVRINWRCNFKLAKSPSFNKHLLILKNKIIFIIIK